MCCPAKRRRSKLILRRDLNDARVRAASLPSALAEGCTGCRGQVLVSIAQARIGVTELRRIRQVEELRSKSEAAPLLYWKDPLDRHVQIVLSRSTDEADTTVA